MRRKNVMLARKFNEATLAKWPTPYILQPKINGRRALVTFDSVGRATILSSEGHVITSLPELQLQLDNSGLTDLTLDGELYNPGWSFQMLCSVVGRTASIHPLQHEVQYWCFDLVNDKPQFLRISQLGHELDNASCLNVVKVQSVASIRIGTYLDHYIQAGFEGIIIRHQRGLYEPLRSNYMMKLKVRQTAVYPIIGFEEAISKDGEPKNELGAFWLQAPNGQNFKVGSGFTQLERDQLWQSDAAKLLKLRCKIYFQELSERGVPIFPIYRNLTD